MISSFEGALLERHLRRCASCSAFAASLSEQTALLRGAELELPQRPLAVPAASRRLRRAATAGAGTLLAAAAAAVLVVLPGSGSDRSRTAAVTGAPVLVSFAASPTPSGKVDVPRLRLQPASIADGPVHGAFSTPNADWRGNAPAV